MVRNLDNGMQALQVIAAQQVVQRTIPLLERRVDEVIAAKPGLVDVVVSAVQIIDSIGLNWLLAVQSRLESLGIGMRLIDPSPIMCDVLLATRLDARFTIEMTSGGNGANGNGALSGGNGEAGHGG